MGEVKSGRDEIKYLVSIYSTIIRREECFLGKRMSTITHNRSKQTLKYLVNRRKETL